MMPNKENKYFVRKEEQICQYYQIPLPVNSKKYLKCRKSFIANKVNKKTKISFIKKKSHIELRITSYPITKDILSVVHHNIIRNALILMQFFD